MGASSSSEHFFQNQPLLALYRLLGQYAKKKKVVVKGGYDSVVVKKIAGEKTLDMLEEYGNSLYSKQKEDMIRDIASDVFKALKIKGAESVKTMPLDKLVEVLVNYAAPNPKEGKMLKSSFGSKMQTDACHIFAESINKHYGSVLIPLNEPVEEMCVHVAEVMNTLLMGLHSEFMSVAGDVSRMVRNLKLALDYIKGAYHKQAQIARQSGSSVMSEQSKAVDELYEAMEREMNRQIALLTNSLNTVITPTAESLITLLEDNKDFAGTIRELKGELGTTAFGDKISHLLSGVSSVAHSANIVERCLKRLGLDFNAYKSASNLSDLRSKVYNRILSQSPSSQELDKLMTAAELLYKADIRHDDIVAEIEKRASEKRGACECGGAYEEEKDGAYEEEKDGAYEEEKDGAYEEERGGTVDYNAFLGGLDDNEDMPPYWKRKSLESRVKTRETQRKILMNDFRRQLRTEYRRVIDAALPITKKIGNEIPVNDDLRHFIMVFKNIKPITKENIHEVLSGYYTDVETRYKREDSMQRYKDALVAMEPLLKSSNSDDFKHLQQAIDSLLRSIEMFGDRFVKALTEIHVESPVEIRQHIRQAWVQGGAESATDFVDFDRVKNELYYYYTIANIKGNLNVTAKELEGYGTDYKEVLGEEAAWMIDQIRADYMKRIKALTQDPGADKPYYDLYRALNVAVQPGLDMNQIRSTLRKNMEFIFRTEMNAKVGMVEVAQAVDLYMKAFADGIAHDPDSIRSVVQMLDQVELVAKWFNDKSGDKLAHLCEVFPSAIYTPGGAGLHKLEHKFSQPQAFDGNTGMSNSNEVVANDVERNSHYYVQREFKWNDVARAAAPGAAAINAGIAAGAGGAAQRLDGVRAAAQGLPGNPFLALPLIEVEEGALKNLYTHVEKTIKSMRALENILSVFASIGSKTGKIDPQANTFMKPGQIYNNLCEYVKASALTNSFGNKAKEHFLSGVYKQNGVAKLFEGNTTRNSDLFAPVDSVLGGPGAAAAAANNNIGNINVQVTAKLFFDDKGKITDDSKFNGDSVIDDILGGGHVDAVGIEVGAASLFDKHTGLVMAAIPPDVAPFGYGDAGQGYSGEELDGIAARLHLNHAGFEDRFFDTDLLFQMTVKAIVAKVFTTVDAYRLFNRPTINRGDNSARSAYSNVLSPIRQILGAGEEKEGGLAPAKVIPEAIELYVRLPLLLEWYREKFGFTQLNTKFLDNEKWLVSLVPNIDGIWSGLFRIIFDTASYVEKGSYTEGVAQQIIAEINQIYSSYRGRYPKDTIRSILVSCVAEVNRVLGFMQRKNIDSFLNARYSSYVKPTNNVGEDEFNEPEAFDLLDADSEMKGTRGQAPSDRFLKQGAFNAKKRKFIMVHLHRAIDEFRRGIDKDFIEYAAEGNKFDFSKTVENHRKEINSAKDPKAQYDVVLRAIQGVTRTINVSDEHMLMLHETVCAPLALLFCIWKILSSYNDLAHGASLRNLHFWAKSNATAGAAPLTAYFDYLQNNIYKAPKISNDQLKRLVYYAEQCVQVAGKNAADIAVFGIARGAADWSINNPAVFNDSGNLFELMIHALLRLVELPDGLISMQATESGDVFIDYSAIETLCMELFSSVKQAIKVLSPNFEDHKIINTFVDEKNVGSLMWIDEHLITTLFKNKYKTGLPGANEHFSITWKALTDNKDVIGPDLESLVGNILNPPAGRAHANFPKWQLQDTMYQRIHEILLYKLNSDGERTFKFFTKTNLKSFPFNVAGIKIPDQGLSAAETKHISTVLSGNLVVAAAGPPDNPNVSNTMKTYGVVLTRLNTYNEDWNYCTEEDSDPNVHGLMVHFNNILAHYVNNAIDPAQIKIFAPLVEGFANGVAANEVMKNNGFGDNSKNNYFSPENTFMRVQMGGNDRPLHRPKIDCLVYASTAMAIKQLLSETDTRLKKRKFLYESAVDIPLHMREKMKANLPYYSKLFDMVARRASAINTLLLRSNLKYPTVLKRTDKDDGGVVVVAQRQFVGFQDATCNNSLDIAAGNEYESVEYFKKLCNRLTALSLSIKKDCDNVYRELQDLAPQFGETYLDQFKDYKLRHGVDPLVLPSNVLLPIISLTYMAQDHKHDLKMDNYKTKKTALAANPALILPGGAGLVPNDVMENVLLSKGLLRSVRDECLEDFHLLLPSDSTGTAVFKYNYSTRLLLARNDIEPKSEHLHCVKSLSDVYNNVSGKATLFNTKQFEELVLREIKLARFVADFTISYRVLRQTAILDHFLANLVGSNNRLAVNIGGDNAGLDIRPYQLKNGNYLPCKAMRSLTNTEYELAKAEVLAAALAAAGAPLAAAAVKLRENQLYELIDLAINRAVARAARPAPFAAPPFDGADVDALVAQVNNLLAAYNINANNLVKNRTSDVIGLIENPDQRKTRSDVASATGPNQNLNSDTDRKKLRVYNVFDMNIVPINVHAFMREVPFTNLLNYSYTLDRMIQTVILPDINDQVIDWNYPAVTPRQILAKLLMYPFAVLDKLGAGGLGREYYFGLASLFNGNDDMRVGRPRYLSDQLWHKVLLNASAEHVSHPQGFPNLPGVRNTYPFELGPAGYQSSRNIVLLNRPGAGRDANNARMRHLSFTAGLKYYGNLPNPVAAAGAYPNGATKGWRTTDTPIMADMMSYFAEIGRMRFDTKLIRSLTWFVQLQRVMRVMLISHLAFINTPVVRSLRVGNPQITEYESNDVFDDDDTTGAKYELI